jgi:hypothetical protein
LIDYPDDPIVAEIRAIRKAHAEKFNNDPHLICEDIRRLERESGRVYVNRQAKRDESDVTAHVTTEDPIPASAE